MSRLSPGTIAIEWPDKVQVRVAGDVSAKQLSTVLSTLAQSDDRLSGGSMAASASSFSSRSEAPTSLDVLQPEPWIRAAATASGAVAVWLPVCKNRHNLVFVPTSRLPGQ